MTTDIAVDLDRWPIVVCRFPDSFDLHQLTPYFAWTRELIAHGQPYVMISDLRIGAVPDSREARSAATAFAAEVTPLSSKVCAAAIQVASSKAVLLALKAVSALNRAPYPVHVVQSWEDGIGLAEEAAKSVAPGPAFMPFVADDWRRSVGRPTAV